MKKENVIGVALVKRACPLCGSLHDAEIVMNTRLTTGQAKNVEDLHGKTVGYLDKPCDECIKHSELGVILIQVDESKTEDHRNPWRTGLITVIKQEAAERIFSREFPNGPMGRAAFVTTEAWNQIGLPNN